MPGASHLSNLREFTPRGVLLRSPTRPPNVSESHKIRTGSGEMEGDEDFCPTEPASNPPSSGGHSMRSNEYSRRALGEGFAHFYAADTWNDHDDNDCWFEYYKKITVGIQDDYSPGVDCEGSATSWFPVAYRHNQCGFDQQDGNGVELDWLRTVWDLHTNGSSPPSFTTILATFIGGATAWGSTEAFTKLDERADDLELSHPTLYENWQYAAYNYNAICYPLQQGVCP